MFDQFSKKKDGGSATDGVSRAAFNKICLEYHEEGMRKPARNGNPGALETGLAQQRRHFLRGRWRDPAVPADLAALKVLWSSMTPDQSTASRNLLEDFSRWKPGPAGRGGERMSRKRGSEDGDSDGEFERGETHSTYPHPGAWDSTATMAPKVDGIVPPHSEMGGPPRKRAKLHGLHSKRDMQHVGRLDEPGLELLCNVAFNSDQMPHDHLPHHHLPLLEPQSMHNDSSMHNDGSPMHNDSDMVADRMVKGDLGNGWHPHHLDREVEMGGSNMPLRDDDVPLDDLHHPHPQHHHYPPHPHSHPHAHQMHRMPASMAMEYGHGHPAHMQRAHMGYGPHQPMGYPHHHMGEHPIGMREDLRDLMLDMLPPHSHRAPAPHLEGAWDSPSAHYRDSPSAHYAPPRSMGGLPPTHSGPMHKSPRYGPMTHKSPRHGPMARPGHSPHHGPLVNRSSPHHGPMRQSPHHAGMHPGKSPRHGPLPPGNPSENRGEMLPPSANWMKSPGLSHMKPKKIPGRCVCKRKKELARVRETLATLFFVCGFLCLSF